jgi:putative FmdB family regulatory protein
MPTYEYGCAACGNEWEEIQRITEAPLEVCPKCGKSTAHRLISAGTGFILKGGGWYSDLYSSSKSSSKKDGGEGTSSSDSGTKTGGAKTDGGDSSSKADKPASTSTESKATPSTPTSTAA